MKFRYDTRYTEHGFEIVPRVPVVFRNPLNFFDHYKVVFEKYKKTFEITAKKNK